MDVALEEDLLAKSGFATTAHTDDYLRQTAVEVYLLLFLSGNEMGEVGGKQFLSLVSEYLFYSIHICVYV